MVLSTGRIDLPTPSGCHSPRQTHLCENTKTVIRTAVEVHAKLRNTNNADGVGDAHHFVPEPRDRCQNDRPTGIGRTGSSSTHGQIGLVPHAEALLSRVRASRSRFHGEATATRSAAQSGRCREDESVSRQTVSMTAHPGRQRQSAGHARHGYQ
jgi:hypothetical protein